MQAFVTCKSSNGANKQVGPTGRDPGVVARIQECLGRLERFFMGISCLFWYSL